MCAHVRVGLSGWERGQQGHMGNKEQVNMTAGAAVRHPTLEMKNKNPVCLNDKAKGSWQNEMKQRSQSRRT